MTVLEIIKASLRKIGGLSGNETPESYLQTEALTALQMMLRAWSQKQILVYSSVSESFSLSAGVAAYSWGSGGTITTTRPHSIIGAYIRDSGGIDYPQDIISEGQYRRLSSKTTSGRPDSVFYRPSYPLAYLYFYPVPSTVEVVYIDSLKSFTETSSFATVNDTLSFPSNYEEAIVYNLAIRLAPEYGRGVSEEVKTIAVSSYSDLTNRNAANQVEPVNLVDILPVGMRSVYDITAG